MEVELLAIFWGLQFCAPLGIPKLIVEIDCLIVVQALEEGTEFIVANKHLISKILNLKNRFVFVILAMLVD